MARPSVSPRSRVTALLSGLAAALILVSLIGGYWALVGSHAQGRVAHAVPTTTHSPLPGVADSPGPIPNDCPAGPTPQEGKIPGLSNGGAIGGPPLWIGRFIGQQPIMAVDGPLGPGNPNYEYRQYGWYGRMYLALDPTFEQTITLTGANLRTGAPLYFQTSQGTVTAAPHISRETVYPAGGVFIPAAGCYVLHARWPGGGWDATFAAGDSGASPLGICSASPAPTVVGPLGSAIGAAPVWVAGFEGSRATMSVSGAVRGEHGLYAKFVWATAPAITTPISLTATSASDGTRLWFQLGSHAPTTSPVLDPTHAGSAQVGGATWASDSGYIFIPGPGCYLLRAAWSGGGWDIPFLAT